MSEIILRGFEIEEFTYDGIVVRDCTGFKIYPTPQLYAANL